MIEKCVNPEKHIWKEVVEELSLDKQQIAQVKKMKHFISKSKEMLQRQVEKLFQVRERVWSICEDLEKLLFGVNII